MTRALPALLAAIALTLPAFALPAFAADGLLSRLAGDWTGRGTYRPGPQAPQEHILCKVTNTLINNGNALQQSGRCSISSGTGTIYGVIQSSGGGRYTGSLNSPASDGPANFSGTGSSNRLTLNMTFTDSHTHASAASVTTMTLTGSGYRLLSTRKDGGWTPTDISFRK